MWEGVDRYLALPLLCQNITTYFCHLKFDRKQCSFFVKIVICITKSSFHQHMSAYFRLMPDGGLSHHIWQVWPRLMPDWRPFSTRPTHFSPGLEAFHNTTDTFVSGESELYNTHEEPHFELIFPFLIMYNDGTVLSLYSHIWCCRPGLDWRPFSQWLTRLTQAHAGLENSLRWVWIIYI